MAIDYTKPFAELNQDEKDKILSELYEGKRTRKADVAAKRAATRQLIDTHKPEFEKLLASAKARK